MQLALFDLDHTLLSGDSDVLWCDFLIEQGVLDADMRQRGQDMADRYRAGTVMPKAYCDFHAATLAGHDAVSLQPLRQRFLHDWIRPRIPTDARALLERHRTAGDTLVLTTATNRAVSELTAADLGVDHYLCTELEQIDGRFTGRTTGVLNIRTGKVDRLRQWLASLGQPERVLADASFYSDSINDLALLSAVRRPVVVDPDPRLESTALWKGWTVLRLNRPALGSQA
ncbi:MAG: HAD family hydrolase [Pseudomonadota bacterium]